MNDISRDDPLAHGPSGLDPELLQLFDQAPSVTPNDEAFVGTLLVRVRRARRGRLLARLFATMAIIVSGAFLAPYVAQATLMIADRMTVYSPVVCV
ncbi:MAG TPA: hypothetical protein VI653_16510, partial [Steroidobacteraceae bacterium]